MKGQPSRNPQGEVELTKLERAAGCSPDSIKTLSMRFNVTPDEVKAALDRYLEKTRHPVKDCPKKKQKMPPRPRGSYQRWSDSEVARLRVMVQKGLDWEEIAKTMGRSVASVRDKARKVCGEGGGTCTHTTTKSSSGSETVSL